MLAWSEWGKAVLEGIPALLVSPFTYITLLIIVLQWRKQLDMQRKLYGNRLHSLAEGIVISVVYGLGAGLLLSIAVICLGIVISPEQMWVLWLIILILATLRLRWFNFVYASVVLAAGALLIPRLMEREQWGELAPLWDTFANVHIPALFALVALLCLTQAVLVYALKNKRGTPVYIHSKRGRLISAYQIQYVWFVPLFALSVGNQLPADALYSGWPIFALDGAAPYALLLLPAVISHVDQVSTRAPQQRSKLVSVWLLCYALILLGLSYGSLRLPELVYASVAFALLGYESLHWWQKRQEGKGTPRYVHPAHGLKVVATIPHSPAAEMGILPDEVILKVNDRLVHHAQQMYEALAVNKTYCKLEIENQHGERKFVGRSTYAGDHHLLGIILAPDAHVPYYIEQEKPSLVRLFLPFRKKRARTTHRNGVSQ